MATECQKTALGLAELVLKYAKNDALDEQEIYKIYQFPDSQERIIAEYIDTFLKHKVEASECPHDVVTDQQKEDYVMDFFNKEVVHLNPAKILKNPGLRALVKLCLNSFW